MLKCANLIEIRFYAYLYASSFFVLGHIIFETTVQIPEVEFGGKYRYLPWGQITNTDFSYYWTCKNEHIATKYVIIYFSGEHSIFKVKTTWKNEGDFQILCVYAGLLTHICLSDLFISPSSPISTPHFKIETKSYFSPTFFINV
jgi:hypothetical protein